MDFQPENDESNGKTGDLIDADYNDGQVRGDTRAMPNRGSDTGVDDTYGASIAPDATNRHGGMGSATDSDPAAATFPTPDSARI